MLAKVLIRPEGPADIDAILAVTVAAFSGVEHSAAPIEPGGDPGEATLVNWLREDVGWIARLSLVAEEDGVIVGHVVASRAHVDDAPAVGLGPVSVLPDRQGTGVGTALMEAVIAAADARHEPLIGLLGDPGYYHRFGFVPAGPSGVIAPNPSWGDSFQVRILSSYAGQVGQFRYAEPFARL